MKDLTMFFIAVCLGIALLLGYQCVRLIDQRQAETVALFAPMMDVLK